VSSLGKFIEVVEYKMTEQGFWVEGIEVHILQHLKNQKSAIKSEKHAQLWNKIVSWIAQTANDAKIHCCSYNMSRVAAVLTINTTGARERRSKIS